MARADLSAAALGDTARAQQALLAALPPRYGEVLLNLIDRLEASALFTEESCSFSRSSLLDHLQTWGWTRRAARCPALDRYCFDSC
jgi:phage portal protein BeeE